MKKLAIIFLLILPVMVWGQGVATLMGDVSSNPIPPNNSDSTLLRAKVIDAMGKETTILNPHISLQGKQIRTDFEMKNGSNDHYIHFSVIRHIKFKGECFPNVDGSGTRVLRAASITLNNGKKQRADLYIQKNWAFTGLQIDSGELIDIQGLCKDVREIHFDKITKNDLDSHESVSKMHTEVTRQP